jgi:hypothetical protein
MEILASLLSALKAVCAAFPDPRKGRSGNIAIADFGLSAFAMFFLQSASFLSFQRTLEKGQGRSNCQTLFRDREDPVRQLYPGHARRRGPRAARAVLSLLGATAA